MFSGPYHWRNILQQLRFHTMRTDRSIWWMWATLPLNYPIPWQHSQRTDASRKHVSSAILCLRNSCRSSTDQHWTIKIKSLLNPSASTLSTYHSTSSSLHLLMLCPNALKDPPSPFSITALPRSFRPCSHFWYFQLLSSIPDSSITFLLSMLKFPPTHSSRDAAERRHHQPRRDVMLKHFKYLRYYFFVSCREQDVCTTPYLGLITSCLYC